MIKKTIAVLLILVLICNVSTGLIIDKSRKNKINNLMNSNIIYVDDDNTQGPWDGTLDYPYKEIWKGVDVSSDGDTVYVLNGTYTYFETTIRIDRSINLKGENKYSTIIDGYNNKNVIEINADNVKLHGFSIKNSGEGYSGMSVSSNSNEIYDNVISDNSRGIYIETYSEENHIFENNFINNGIVTFSTKKQIIHDNIINNNDLIYLYDETNKDITDAGQVIIVDSSDIVVKNNQISHASIGMIVLDSRPIYIRNNDISNNKYGIYSSSSKLWIDEIFKVSDSYNNIYDNEFGIYLILSSCYISSNKIYENNMDGIFLSDCDECNIIYNNIFGNQDSGIHLKHYSEKNYIYENSIVNNQNNGIFIEQNSNENQIYNNQFYYNGQNAKSVMCQNIWYTVCSSIYSGNFWHDYENRYPNSENNGYTWNTPYKISNNEQDNFPLISPYGTPFPPEISGPISIKKGVKYSYTAKSEDPQIGDDLYYLFDWGDGTNSGWIGPVEEGKSIKSSHIWNDKGSYEIKAKAKDENDWNSGWSEPVNISVTKSKKVGKNPILWDRFIDTNFPFLFKFMNFLKISINLPN